MDEHVTRLPECAEELRATVLRQQAVLDDARQRIEAADDTISRQHKSITLKDAHIKALEHRLLTLNVRQFGKSSEKNPDQFDFFNEAELLAGLDTGDAADDEGDDSAEPAGPNKRKPRKSRKLPEHLPRVEVVYDLLDEDKRCECGKTMLCIGNETLEQLGVIPQQFYVIAHLRLKYACACKGCIRIAAMPAQPLPASAASAPLVAHSMVSKFHDGLPLYRQEKMAGREGLDLSRAKLARWHIGGARGLQPIFNLLQDALASYDIAQSDATGIQVLKENGRSPESASYLWIRRGGPPDKPVVLVDYSPSHSGAVAHGLLEDFHGYLVCDAAPVFNEPARRNGLVLSLCNDHARRKFREALVNLDKSKASKGSIAAGAIKRYRALYLLERRLKALEPEQRHRERQKVAVPLWDDFIAWATKLQAEGVAHAPTRAALAYLLNHAEGLRRYCDDGRLPISNIAAEHVAKTIAVARKNFLFADTPAGARSSGLIYSVLESARANGHHAQRYMAVLLAELPNAREVADIEALLPWNLTPDEVARRYATYPTL